MSKTDSGRMWSSKRWRAPVFRGAPDQAADMTVTEKCRETGGQTWARLSLTDTLTVSTSDEVIALIADGASEWKRRPESTIQVTTTRVDDGFPLSMVVPQMEVIDRVLAETTAPLDSHGVAHDVHPARTILKSIEGRRLESAPRPGVRSSRPNPTVSWRCWVCARRGLCRWGCRCEGRMAHHEGALDERLARATNLPPPVGHEDSHRMSWQMGPRASQRRIKSSRGSV